MQETSLSKILQEEKVIDEKVTEIKELVTDTASESNASLVAISKGLLLRKLTSFVLSVGLEPTLHLSGTGFLGRHVYQFHQESNLIK